jgi:hypothetical protein
MHPYTTSGGGIAAGKCFETITKDGTNTIVLIPNGENIGLEDFKSRPRGRLALKPKAKRKRLDVKGSVNSDDNEVENGDGNGDDNEVKIGSGNGGERRALKLKARRRRLDENGGGNGD